MRTKILISLFWLCAMVSFSQTIEIAVHRGANRQAPENTLPAAHLAAELGGDYLEIDVRQNHEGVFFNFHDATLDRTSDGTGAFYTTDSADLKKLDVGSWYRAEYIGEQIPTVAEIVQALKGKIKFYFDFKQGDIEEFIHLIQQWGVAEDCFFTLPHQYIPNLQKHGISYKVNVSNVDELVEAHQKYNPPMVEVRATDLSEALINQAKKLDIKVMVYVPGDQYELYAHSLNYDIDVINLDNPDVFKTMESTLKWPKPQWIAHRGTVVNDKFEEYDPAGIEEIVHRNYAGVEIDIWETKDGHLVVHHDRSLEKVFGLDQNIDEKTWEELKSLKAKKGGYPVLKLEQYLALIPKEALLMPDLKTKDRSPSFYSTLRAAIEKKHSMEQCVFIDKEARAEFFDESRFSVRVAELPEIFEQWKAGEPVARHYFLFDHGNRLNAESVRAAQMMSMDVIPSVNIFHYKLENFLWSGCRDIQNLRKLGVTLFQIDAVFEEYLSSFQPESSKVTMK